MPIPTCSLRRKLSAGSSRIAFSNPLASGDQSPQFLPANPPHTVGPIGSSPRLGSQPLSELHPSDNASPFVCHSAADVPSSSGRPNFNLPQPPRFGTISVDSDVSSWLYKVGKVCRLSGCPKSDWSTFASTLLENTPQTLVDPAETEACKTSSQVLENDWDNFVKWCKLNLLTILLRPKLQYLT